MKINYTYILKIIIIFGIMISIAFFLPQIRQLLITITEFILGRELNSNKWQKIILKTSVITFIFFSLFSVFIMIKFKINFRAVLKHIFRLLNAGLIRYLTKLSNKSIKFIKNINIILNFILEKIWILPAIFSTVFVLFHGVNVLFNDDWNWIRHWEHIEKNGINFSLFSILFQQSGQHRYFLSGIIMVFLNRITDLNMKVNIYVIQTMVIITYIIFIKYLNSNKSSNLLLHNYYKLLLGIGWYSLIQYVNFLMGHQVVYYMAIFAFVISIYFFDKYIQSKKVIFTISSLIFGIIASFSSFHGIFIWPIIIIIYLICFLSKDKISFKLIVPYIITAVICFLIYFLNWKFTSANQNLNNNAYILLQFLFSSIGAMYTGNYSILSILLGILTVMISIVFLFLTYITKKIKKNIFPIGLIGLSYSILFATAVGRASFYGLEHSAMPGYMTFSLLSFIGIILLYNSYDKHIDILIKNISKIKKFSGILLYLNVILLGIFILNGFIISISKARYFYNFNMNNITIIENFENQPLDKLSRLYHGWRSYEHAYDSIEKLQRYRLSVFSNPKYNYIEISTSRLNELNYIELNQYMGFNNESFYWDDRYLSINGWAIDHINEREYSSIYVKVNEKLYRCASNQDSEDVAWHFKNSNYSNVRFSFSFPIENLNIGDNTFSIIVVLYDNITYYETHTIIIFRDYDGNIFLNN